MRVANNSWSLDPLAVSLVRVLWTDVLEGTRQPHLLREEKGVPVDDPPLFDHRDLPQRLDIAHRHPAAGPYPGKPEGKERFPRVAGRGCNVQFHLLRLRDGHPAVDRPDPPALRHRHYRVEIQLHDLGKIKGQPGEA